MRKYCERHLLNGFKKKKLKKNHLLQTSPGFYNVTAVHSIFCMLRQQCKDEQALLEADETTCKTWG